MPTLFSAVYFFLLAAPQYVSETSFVVRGPAGQQGLVLSDLLSSQGENGATENTFAVQNYMTSRDAAALLRQNSELREAFNRPGADALARFPGWLHRDDFEHFFWYYKKHITAELDTSSGISTLRVRTFRPEDSKQIAEIVISASEALVNRMNERQRQNTIGSALHEVELAEEKYRSLSRDIARYRTTQSLLDPERQSQPLLEQIVGLEDAEIAVQLKLTDLLRATPQSPLIPVYQRQREALAARIVALQPRITGKDDSLVSRIPDYADLQVRRQLLERELAADATALAAARAEANRQAVYLDQVATPNLPDYAVYPHRLVSVIVTFVSCFALFLMARLLIAGAREHQDV
ncbi:capsule biosynthesis protein [Gluconacetobacter azotocaptans]|uniref:Capsule biosynthesis protein n=1 Tax=Gluconacetobacter azotocaptans TaxID=142834 RepID=A0A7W4PCI3_9PROT|nr:capsule biosynthesis protein [Gluconacetobacter azotocaptans]